MKTSMRAQTLSRLEGGALSPPSSLRPAPTARRPPKPRSKPCGFIEEGLTTPRDVSLRAEADGTEQFYMEMLPAGFDPHREYDTIIGLHGHGADRKQFASDPRPECAAFRAFAASHGMIAVTPDYRAPTSWMGPKAEADLVQLVGALKSRYRVRRLFLVGGSMGGASALTFAVLHPDLVDGVTAMNGHANHLEFAGFQDAIAESFGGSKDTIPEEYRKRSAEYWPEVLTMPIAFTVGSDVINRPQGGHATNVDDAMAAMAFMLAQVL